MPKANATKLAPKKSASESLGTTHRTERFLLSAPCRSYFQRALFLGEIERTIELMQTVAFPQRYSRCG